METALGLAFFILGSIIGSFLNVVILRYRSGRGIGGRSKCFSCGKTLTWFELVPLASFLTQGGKCAHCRTRISWQYPLVEAATGLIFVILFVRFEYLLLSVPALFGVLFAYYAFIFSVLVVISAYDLKHGIVPDGLSALFAVAAVLGMFFLKGDALIVHVPTAWHLLAGIALAAPFAVVWLVSRGRWMGLGDAKLMIGMGWLLGMSAGVAALLLSFWIGAAVSVLVLLGAMLSGRARLGMKTAIPFGPFLALGTFIAVVAKLDFAGIIRFFSH